MILALLFLLGGIVLAGMVWHTLRRASSGDWVRAEGTRLLVETEPGAEAPRLSLTAGGGNMFGPVAADWEPPAALAAALGNPGAEPGRLGGAVTPGSWRVSAAVDLDAPDALGSGTPALDEALRKSLGRSALVLERVGGGVAPVLLHGRNGRTEGSVGGIAVEHARLALLQSRLGDPTGLAVEVVRRRIQRAGWGTERAQRRRSIG
jgi:hypothetical protein